MEDVRTRGIRRDDAVCDSHTAGAITKYAPVDYLGEAAGLFVGIIRVDDQEMNETLSVIVGPRAGICGQEVAAFADTRNGAMMAQTVGMAVLRALHLTGSWRPGTSWQQEEA